MEILNVEAWREILTNSLTSLWSKIANFAPNLIGAIIILVVGYFSSKILAKISQSVLSRIGFDKLCDRIGIHRTLKSSGIDESGSQIVALIIFWLIMLMFLISISETVGLDNVAQTIESFVLYLPNVIGAVIIFVIGATIAGLIRDLVNGAATRIGMEYAKPLSSVVYGVLVVIVSVLSIDQLQIDTSFLANALQILLLAIGAALALTLGLGTRNISQQLVSGVYAREIYTNGDQVQLNDITGVIEEVGTVSCRIVLPDGNKVLIPNNKLISATVTKLS